MAYGYVSGIRQIISPYFDDRPNHVIPTLLVIHNTSLPPKQYSGNYVEQLLTGTPDACALPYFALVAELRVSCHFFLRRDGEVIQCVSCDKRAWHAGKSSFEGRENCNDFSVGIELEGSDDEPFMQTQYVVLAELTLLLSNYYPINNIVGHNDIAPMGKTDPGPYFDWNYYSELLKPGYYDRKQAADSWEVIDQSK